MVANGLKQIPWISIFHYNPLINVKPKFVNTLMKMTARQ
jgi:hypothetical protein